MKDYYQALGVNQNATPAVVKIAYEGQLRALERSSLDEAQRKAEEKLLNEAYVTLSNPAKKTWYDAQLEKHHETQGRAASAGTKRAAAIAAAVVLVLAAGTAWYMDSRAKERARLEQERIALEREVAAKRLEAEQARIAAEREAKALAAAQSSSSTTTARFRAYDSYRQENARQFDRVIDHVESNTNRACYARDRAEQRYTEDRARRQADEDARKARAEVERQNRWVAQQEREEERLRRERDLRGRHPR